MGERTSEWNVLTFAAISSFFFYFLCMYLFKCAFLCAYYDDEKFLCFKLNSLLFTSLVSSPVVGEKEKTAGTVNVRTRDNIVHGEFSIGAVIEKFSALQKNRTLASEENF